MRKYFLYELKKHRWTLLLLTVIASVIYVGMTSTETLFSRAYDDPTRIIPNDSNIGFMYAFLGIVCAVVPVIMYSFKMSKRSIDTLYAVPIKREKLWLAKTLVGLILVFVPYTVAYWLGFATIALRENYYKLFYYLPGYTGGLFYGLCMYGIFSFAFTRANHVVDGIVFMLFYCFVGMMFYSMIDLFVSVYRMKHNPAISYWNPVFNNVFDANVYGGVASFAENISDLLRGYRVDEWRAIWFWFPALYASVSYALFFSMIRFEKGENAEQVSESWFGYKVMIPFYLFVFLALSDISSSIELFLLLAVAAVVGSVIYKRKIRFGWKWWVTLGATFLAGFLSSIVIFVWIL